MDRARRRELKHAGVLAARQARVDLAGTIATLEAAGAGEEGRALAGRLAFAVAALYGAEVGEPEGVRDRLREASGVLSGVLARLAEPGTARALDDAGASIAKCLAVLYPARAGLERELEAASEGESSRESGSVRAPVVELPARAASPSFSALESARSAPVPPPESGGDDDDEPEEGGRPKRRTSPGVAPPSSPMIPLAQLMQPEVPTSIARRTLIRGTDDAAPKRPSPPSAPERREAEAETRISRPPAALLREATPSEALTFVGKKRSQPPSGPAAARPASEPPPAEARRPSSRPPPDGADAVPLKRKRRKALELVPDADEGLVDRASGSPMMEGAERRTAERLELTADIGLHSATQFFTGLSGDISRGGLFVATWAPLPLGTEVTVSFVLPGGHPITAPGLVTWIREAQGEGIGEGSPGMGVRFVALSPGDRAAIERFLQRRPALFHDS
ncbi:MAG: TIGR02266 family protein [Sandaracinus sp.]